MEHFILHLVRERHISFVKNYFYYRTTGNVGNKIAETIFLGIDSKTALKTNGLINGPQMAPDNRGVENHS